VQPSAAVSNMLKKQGFVGTLGCRPGLSEPLCHMGTVQPPVSLGRETSEEDLRRPLAFEPANQQPSGKAMQKKQKKQNKQKQGASAGGSSGSDGGSGDDSDAGSSSSDAQRRRKPYKPKTWIHSIFEGVLTSETRCLCCESVTSRDECFLDLSLEVEQNSSVSACMRNFSAPESLRDDNKFYCDTCCSLQEAKKCIRIKHLPNVLALHLKRFKYIEQLQRFKKLSYRISFPMELNLPNIAEAADNPDRTYRLFAVVVHVGSGPNHGHYISLVRSHQHWLLFDDESVDVIEEASIQSCFGSAVDTAANTDTGYILFYQATDWDSSGEEEQPPPGRPPGPERPPGRRSPPKSAGAKDVGL